MNAAAVQFDAEAHTYTVDGVLFPSVTQVLGDLSARIYRFVNAADMVRTAQLGTAVHAVIELDAHDQLDEDDLDDGLRPYLDMWRQFKAQSGFQVILSEQRVVSQRYGYAGTLDLFGRLHKRLALADAKRCAAVPKTAGPQTAGYEIALRECHPEFGIEPIDRYALHLTPERWQLVPLRDRDDSRVFLSALTLHKWSNSL